MEQVKRTAPNDFLAGDIKSAFEAAKALDVSTYQIKALRHRGMPWISFGGKVYFDMPSVVAWILENCQGPTMMSTK